MCIINSNIFVRLGFLLFLASFAGGETANALNLLNMCVRIFTAEQKSVTLMV